MIGFGIVIPALPLFAKGSNIGATNEQLAWIVSIYSLVQFVFSPLLGRLSDRIGRRPVLAISILGTAFGFLVIGFAATVTMILVGRIIDGISGGNISTAMACIADSTTKEERSRSMGMVGAAFGLGFVIGPALGGWLLHFGVSVPFYFAAALALINAILVFARLPETLTPEVRARSRDKASFTEVFRGRCSMITITLISQIAGVTGFTVMTALFAIYCQKRYAYSEAQIGNIFAFVGIVGVLMQGGVVRRLLRKPIEKPLAIIGTATLAASMAALAIIPSGSTGSATAFLLLVCAGISIGNSLSTPTLNGIASRSVEPHCQGTLMGLMQGAGALGRFFGPHLAFGLLRFDQNDTTAYGRTAFIASAVLLALDCLLLCALRVPPPPVEETA